MSTTAAGTGLVAAQWLSPFADDLFAADQAALAPGDGEGTQVTLKINGKAQTLQIDPRTTLLDALRERLT